MRNDDVDFDEWQQVQETHYDHDGAEELVTVLVLTIAEAKGVDPLDTESMPPLYESIDAAALEDTFFGPAKTGPTGKTGIVTFHYDTCKVSVDSDGWISVYEPQ